MNTTSVTFADHSTEQKSVFGEQYTAVRCTARINGEYYSILYHRSPITGELRSCTCAPRAEETTTENTLTCEAVQDACWDELQN